MKPKTIGRALGIGLRVAGRVAGERLAGQGQAAAHAPQNQRVVGASATSGAANRAMAQTAGQKAGRASSRLAHGIGGFLRPFGSVGRKLWLEIVGVFFLLPVLVFGPWMWRTRASWRHGHDHGTFVISAVIVAVFLYLTITSFWRAWRK
ncbi:MAG: hypothetical protein ACRD3Y_09495 [Bryobacteraceae bacterium]